MRRRDPRVGFRLPRQTAGPVEGVLHATQRETRVLTNQFLRAHSIARLNGAQNLFMLANRPRITAWFRWSDNRGGRGESDGLNTIERELKHRAFRECNQSLVKSQIQFTEACHLLDSRRFRGAERSRRGYEFSLDTAGPVELRGIGDSPCCQTGGHALQRAARLDRVGNILPGEDTRRVSTLGQFFEQPLLMELFQGCANDRPRGAELF